MGEGHQKTLSTCYAPTLLRRGCARVMFALFDRKLPKHVSDKIEMVQERRPLVICLGTPPPPPPRPGCSRDHNIRSINHFVTFYRRTYADSIKKKNFRPSMTWTMTPQYTMLDYILFFPTRNLITGVTRYFLAR